MTQHRVDELCFTKPRLHVRGNRQTLAKTRKPSISASLSPFSKPTHSQHHGAIIELQTSTLALNPTACEVCGCTALLFGAAGTAYL